MSFIDLKLLILIQIGIDIAIIVVFVLLVRINVFEVDILITLKITLDRVNQDFAVDLAWLLRQGTFRPLYSMGEV